MLQARPLEEIKPGGLGLHLIRRAFDKVEYVLHDVGTELVLAKSLPSVPAK
jgi:anti-sigma regulatory factor (Ser/Thr protein kinase)